VTCRFGYKFTVLGNHSVQVRVQNVTPRDYDPSNNQLSGSIVVNNPVQLFYSVSVYQETDSMTNTTDTYATGDSTVADSHVESPMTTMTQSRHFSGKILSAVKLPLAKLSYADSTDGGALNALTYTSMDADMVGCASDDPNYTTLAIANRFDDTTGGWVTMRVYQNASTGAGLTLVDGGWDAGEVTYVTTGYCNSVAGTYFQCGSGDWLQNPATTVSWGALASLGSTYSANLVVDDGNSYSVSPSFPLTTTTSSIPLSTTCSAADFGGASLGKICTTFGQDTTVVSGGASVQPQ
jgi:hypothetical protein